MAAIMFAVDMLRRRGLPALKTTINAKSIATTDLFFQFPSCPLIPSAAASSTARNHHHHHQRRRRGRPKSSSSSPAMPTQSEIDAAVADHLPPRFTASDLTDAIDRLPDPRLCLPFLSHAASRPSPGSRPDSSSFLAAVHRLAAARLHHDLHSAASLALSILPAPTLSEPLLHTIISSYSGARMLSRAVSVFKRMRSHPDPLCRPSLRTYNALFAAFIGREGKSSFVHHAYMDTIRCLFRQMVDSGVRPDVESLNFVILGYVQSLHLNDALRVFHQMATVYGCEPDEHSYNCLVHGLCAQGRTVNAREMFDEMRRKGMVPSARACCSMAGALAVAGDREAAVEMVWEMERMGRRPDAVTCRAVLEETSRRDGRRGAESLLEELRARGLVAWRDYKQLLGEIPEYHQHYHNGE